MRDLDPSQYGEADRREVDPPIEVESATWSAGGQLHWWVKERQEWWGRVPGQDGHQGSEPSIFVAPVATRGRSSSSDVIGAYAGAGKSDPVNQNGFSDHFPITMTVTEVD
jgi:hypothetical protein